MPATGFNYPGPFNTFIPNHEATGKLVINYSRNPRDFPLNQYVTLQPVKQVAGYYMHVAAENAARVLSTRAEDQVWPEGQTAPQGNWNTEAINWRQYSCIRYATPWQVGKMTVDNASWDVLDVIRAQAAQQRMTARAQVVLQRLLDTSLWGANTATAESLAGGGTGGVHLGTAADPRFKRILLNVARQINRATLGTVNTKDLVMVMSPTVASALATSEEIHAYLQQSPFALAQIRGDVPNQNGTWGLPEVLYGVRLIIEDTVIVTDTKQVNRQATTRYALDPATGNDHKVLVLARPGGLVSYSGPNFSTVHLFMYEEMVVEEKYDEDNRVYRGRIVDNFAVEVVSPISGYLITDALKPGA